MPIADNENTPVASNEIDWIVPPGLQRVVEEFYRLSKTLQVNPKEPMSKKKPLLICGDTGVGKSMFCNIFEAIYKSEYNVEKEKIRRLNIASLHEGTIESELFGHKKGAFTGADKDKDGHITLADRGLLIIEEIGDIPPSIQAKLLTFLEDGYYFKLGDIEKKEARVQIIATTNQPKDKFRLDFWNRLFPFYIPALYERRMDVLYYLYCFHPEIIKYLLESEVLALLAYHWPGNVREIDNIGHLMKWKDWLRFSGNPQVKYIFKSSIMHRNNKYTTLNLNVMSRPFFQEFQWIEKLKSYLKKIGFDIESEKVAFGNKTKITPEKYDGYKNEISELGLEFLQCNEFNMYYNDFENLSKMFLYPLREYQHFDLLDLKKGDNTIIDRSRLERIPNDWTTEDCELQNMIYEYRCSTEKNKLNIHTMTQKDILRELYLKRIETCGSIKQAAKSLGIPESTFRDTLKRDYPDLLPQKQNNKK